jgi:hypothetical protein
MSALEKFNMAPSYSLYDEMIPFCIGWLIGRSLLEQEVAKVSILARTKRKIDFQHVCKDAEGYKLLNRKSVISLEFCFGTYSFQSISASPRSFPTHS